MVRPIDEVFADSLRQRCLVHKKQIVPANVPQNEQAEVATFLNAVYQAPSEEIARSLADRFVLKYADCPRRRSASWTA